MDEKRNSEGAKLSQMRLLSRPIISSEADPNDSTGAVVSSDVKVECQNGEYEESKTKTSELESQIAKLSIQFQSLAERYNEIVFRLQESQNDVYNLKKQNFELQLNNMELLKSFRQKERRIQKLTQERLTSSFGHVFTPINPTATTFSERSRNAPHGVCVGNAGALLPPMSLYDPVNFLDYTEKNCVPDLDVFNQNSTSLLNQTLLPSTPFKDRVLSEKTNTANLEMKADNELSMKESIAHAKTDCESPTSVLGFQNTPKKNSSNLPSPASLQDLTPMISSCLTLESECMPSNTLTMSSSISLPGQDSENKSLNRSQPIPKSISIRANGLLGLKASSMHSLRKRAGSPDQGEVWTQSPVLSPLRPHRLRLTSPAGKDKMDTTAMTTGGAENLAIKELEWEVYDQGMYKTELCNKWQETGTCPYGDRCQFAHGMEELRPVLRHPRYKTELCRMVAAGEVCPYGHRCHFRHSLTKEEKAALV